MTYASLTGAAWSARGPCACSMCPRLMSFSHHRRYVRDARYRPHPADDAMQGQRLTISAGLTLLLGAATPLVAFGGEAGVTSDRILFGQAAALAGPSSALGQGMRQGILAAFAEVNAKGGVHGRKLELISRDDGYDPDRSG